MSYERSLLLLELHNPLAVKSTKEIRIYNMLHKLRFIYVHHFKLVAVLNFSLSLYLAFLFVIKGFDKVNLYNIAFALKLVAYAATVGIEKLFFANRSIYYRNFKLSYRRILGTFFTLDFITFLSILLSCYLWMNFI